MKMQKIEVHIKNTEKWIKLIHEDLELINDKEDYLHGHYITPDIDESEITIIIRMELQLTQLIQMETRIHRI